MTILHRRGGLQPITSQSEVERDAELEHLDINQLYRLLDQLQAPALEALNPLPQPMFLTGPPPQINWAEYNARRAQIVREIELRQIEEAKREVARYDALLAQMPPAPHVDGADGAGFDEIGMARAQFERARREHARHLERLKDAAA